MPVITYLAEDFDAVIKAVHSGDLKPRGMVTKVIRPDEVAEEGFKALVEDKDNQVKILVDMSISVSYLSGSCRRALSLQHAAVVLSNVRKSLRHGKACL